MQISNEPIIGQHLSALGHVDMVKMMKNILMGKKGEHGMVADSRWADLSILKTADLLGFSHTANCGVHRQGAGK